MKKISILTSVVLVYLAGLVSAHTGDDSYSHHDMMGSWSSTSMWGMNWFGWLFAILVIVLLVLLIVWLSKQIKKK